MADRNTLFYSASRASIDPCRSLLRNNRSMTDVSLYVAAITAAAGIIGALIPQLALVLREVRQAERDRRERATAEARDACVDLMRAAGELRILAENISSYRGDANGMRARVEEVRGRADAAGLYAARVSLLVPGQLAEPAGKVAAAARGLASEVVQNTDLNRGVMVGNVNADPLDTCIADFRKEAVKYVSG